MSIGLILYLVGGVLMFFFSVIINSCEEGSCTCDDLCLNCCWLLTCGGCLGLCDCRKSKQD